MAGAGAETRITSPMQLPSSSMQSQALERAAALLKEAANIAVLTGAGVSAESGLATFRGPDGLWEGQRVEDVATPFAFRRNPELVCASTTLAAPTARRSSQRGPFRAGDAGRKDAERPLHSDHAKRGRPPSRRGKPAHPGAAWQPAPCPSVRDATESQTAGLRRSMTCPTAIPVGRSFGRTLSGFMSRCRPMFGPKRKMPRAPASAF